MKAYESTGRTTEEAISSGLMHMGVAIGDVQIEILEEGSKGLFGLFGSRNAKVRLTLKEEDKSISDTRALFANSLDASAYRNSGEQTQARGTDKKMNAALRQEPKPMTPARQAPPRPEHVRAESDGNTVAARIPSKPNPITAAEKPAMPVSPAAQVDRGTLSGQAQEFLQTLTKLMGVQVEIFMSTDEEGNIRANMVGDTLGILIGRRGETLDALQYLTSLQVNKGRQEYTRITLDTEDYRAKREEALVRLANRMANRAQKTGRKVAMEPMNPYERRILHSALQNNPAVTTHSEGEEPNRHVVITLNSNVAKANEQSNKPE